MLLLTAAVESHEKQEGKKVSPLRNAVDECTKTLKVQLPLGKDQVLEVLECLKERTELGYIYLEELSTILQYNMDDFCTYLSQDHAKRVCKLGPKLHLCKHSCVDWVIEKAIQRRPIDLAEALKEVILFKLSLDSAYKHRIL